MQAGFDTLDLSPALLAVVQALGYQAMTPIQAEAIPLLLAGKDLIGQSKTGSGKTAAFTLPILQNLDLEQRALQAIILCPTRELCAQVAREIRKLGRRHKGLQVLLLCGGEALRPQANALERGVHIAVGTPGRIVDHLSRGTLRLGTVRTVVLDEADRMLDMGFQEEMDRVLRELPKERQTVFFSATFPASIKSMSGSHQRHATRVTIDDDDGADSDIHQLTLTVDPHHKLKPLFWALGSYPHDSALIFCNMKVTVSELVRNLHEAGVSVDRLHGDLEQFQRDRVMAMFRNGSVRVLVATDVAARGLDVEDLDLVINYDLPPQPEVYLHRIGRTGRAGKSGLSISFATSREKRKLAAIEELTGAPLERIKIKGEDSMEELSNRLSHAAEMDTIQISGGRKDKVRPGDILGALTGEAGGLPGSAVGKIEIHDRLCYVAVSRGVSHQAVESLNNGKIKGRRFRAVLLPRFEL